MEKRVHGRRRVLKTGLLILNSNSTVECLVRELGGGGAKLWLHGWMALPERFDLMIPADNLRVACRPAWQRGQEVGLEFVGPSITARRQRTPQAGRVVAA